MKLAMLLLGLVFLLAGCTTRNWYDTFQMQQRDQCGRYLQQYEVQRCLDRVNNMTFDQYQNQRELLKAKQ